MKQNIIVICGPTGIGKTSLTIRAAKAFNGQIINADSLQLYRYMDIGTAKPTLEERAQVPHYIVDMLSPDEPFDAAGFAKKADGLIESFVSQGITPFVAGGTGLYIKALVDGLFRATPADPEILDRLQKEAEISGTEALYNRLTTCDSEAAERIHPNDTFRIIRALEVFETTGCTISKHQQSHHFGEKRYRALKIGLTMDRDRLYDRINRRVDIMIAQGLLDEVRSLVAMGYHPDLKPMKSLGYRHMAEYLNGEKDWEEAVRTLKRDTRRYAKRQMTWFRADNTIEWFEPDATEAVIERIKHFLEGQRH